MTVLGIIIAIWGTSFVWLVYFIYTENIIGGNTMNSDEYGPDNYLICDNCNSMVHESEINADGRCRRCENDNKEDNQSKKRRRFG